MSDWWESERELIHATMADLREYRKTLRQGTDKYFQVGYRLRTWGRYLREIDRARPLLSPDELRKRRAKGKDKKVSEMKAPRPRRKKTA